MYQMGKKIHVLYIREHIYTNFCIIIQNKTDNIVKLQYNECQNEDNDADCECTYHHWA